MKVLSGVLIDRCIAAAHVAAGEAEPEMDPYVAHFEALLAASRAGPYVPNPSEMRTLSHEILLGREPASFRPHPDRARDAGAEIACGL
jgi:hypothetical protein